MFLGFYDWVQRANPHGENEYKIVLLPSMLNLNSIIAIICCYQIVFGFAFSLQCELTLSTGEIIKIQKLEWSRERCVCCALLCQMPQLYADTYTH